jgi:hypothetical protein
MRKPEFIVTRVVGHKIMDAECSACHESLYAPTSVSRHEQEVALKAALSEHVKRKHPATI